MMEDPYKHAEDEVIAGSEGEDDMDAFIPAPLAQSIEPIESIAGSTHHSLITMKAGDMSIIEEFSSYNPSTKPARPKPRPLFKNKQNLDNLPESSIAAISSPAVLESIDFLTPSIADRAKMRSRSTKAPITPAAVSNDFIELSSSEDEFNLLPPTKTQKKKKTTAKAKSKAQEDVSIMDSTLEPSAKPKKRKKPAKQTSPIRNYDSHMADPPTSSSNITSPSSIAIPFKLLPPEVPPAEELPPIAVLPHSDPLLSSPCSLFGSPPPARKRKRSQVSSLVDELDADDPLDCVQDYDQPLPVSTGPPSTFFAASSPLPPNSSPGKSAGAGNNSHQEEFSSSISDGRATKKQKKGKKKLEMEVVITKPPKKSKSKKVASAEIVQNTEDLSSSADLDSRAVPQLSELSMGADCALDEAQLARSNSKKTKRSKEPTGTVKTPNSKKRSRGGKKAIANSDEATGSQNDATAWREESCGGVDAPNVTQLNNKGALLESNKRPIEGRWGIVAFDEKGNSNVSGVTLSEGEGDAASNVTPPQYSSAPRSPKDNVESVLPEMIHPEHAKAIATPKPLGSRHSIAPMTRASPMSELIRRVNSMPGSAFRSPKPRIGTGLGTAYSPLLKSSRSALSRIAPLHPNRRTPPPPLPPPPPRKKTKKELEMEEKWEEELIETAGGTTEWACMTDAERAEMRRAKREREMAGWED